MDWIPTLIDREGPIYQRIVAALSRVITRYTSAIELL
jgi:hypothetical protein